MASGAQLSEVAGGFGGEFEVSSSKKVTGEVEGVVAGGEIGVASANQVVDGTEGAGGLFGVFPTNQATVGEFGAGHDDLVFQEAEGLGGAIGVVSAVQVTKTGCFDGGNGVVSSNQLTREPEGVVGEIGVPSVDQIIREPEGMSGEIMVASANHVKGEAEASESVIRGTAVNHETNEAGASSGDNKELSVEAGTSGDEVREVPVNNVTGEAEATRYEIDLFSANQVSGEPAGMGGEIGVASADIMNETGGGNAKTVIASANKGNPEPGGGDDEVGVASVIKVNMKPEGQIGGIGIASVNQVIGEPGDVAGESGVASTNQMNAEAGAMGDQNGVASTNQENVELGSVGGESCVASANQLVQQSGGECNSFEMGSANQMIGQPKGEGNLLEVAPANHLNGQPEGKSSKFGVASANHLNGQPEGKSSKFGVASANQVNGKPGGRSGEVWLPSANQLNEEPVGEIGLASAYQVNEKPIGEIRVVSLNPVNEVSGQIVGEHKVEEKHRWVETKVYRRRPKGEKKKGVLSHITVGPAQNTIICNGNGSQNNKTIEVSTSQSNHNHSDDRVDGSMVVETEKLLSVPASGDNATLKQIQPKTMGEVISNKELSSDRMNSATPILVDPPVTNGALRPLDFATDRRVKIKLASNAKPELQELKRKFESELYSVRKAVKRMDGGREEVVHEFFHPVVNSSLLPNGQRSNGFATQVYSGTRSLGHVPYKPNIRPFNQLRVSVVENGQGMVDSIEREKRTPKANQFYRNSEFLLANDKFPPTESNKKSKSNGKKSSGGEFGFGVGSKVYKSCTALLEKLMKHKHGWVFNAPVDVKGLGLVDYFLIIKNPMDLGTVKAKLIKYWYKSPMEFAEDVRLTFHNAMLYNPKGHDVHIMAETLLKIFEGKWPDIEVKYLRELRMAVEPDMGYPTPTSRITNPFQSTAFPPLETRVFNRSESMPLPVNPKPRTLTPAPSFRTPALKKPKANDVNKRDMTYGEKQKLSTNLQSLPPEKLDGVIQIIKKRSTALSQNDDEIEVDIDSVDTETLWELDRFVTNYKKSLSKNRRKAELANQMRAEARQAAEKFTTPQPLPPKESAVGYGNATLSLPPHQNDPAANASRSSSSSSSSSSGSSSSDSDSDSSSEESDGGRSSGT